MKKLIGLVAVLVITVVALGAVAGLVYAQAPTPNPVPFGPGGMMGGRGGRGGMGGGMMGGYAQTGETGPMHEVMVAAMAKALNMEVKDLEAALDSGKTMWDVAQEQGLSQEQFVAAMQSAREAALKQMVADGVITQAQADWMLQRGMGGRGGNAGNCPGMNGGQRGPGRGAGGGRWNPQPAPATPTNNG